LPPALVAVSAVLELLDNEHIQADIKSTHPTSAVLSDA
jgi:hypothetical protein